MSDKQKTINNPMLMGALELLRAENTQDHRNMVMQEILRARFLVPVVVEPPLEANEEGVAKVEVDRKMNFMLLSASDGNSYFMGFTDMEELKRWNTQSKHQIFALKFSDYVQMLLKPDCEVNGVVINPFDHNLVITKDMIQSMLSKSNYSQDI